MDLSTPMDVWPIICSANSSHQLDTAPQILSWFNEWIVRSKSSMFPDSAEKCIAFLHTFFFQDSSVERTCTSENGITTFCKVFDIIWSATLHQFPSGLCGYVPHHFSSFPGPRNDQMSSLKSFSRNLWLLWNSKCTVNDVVEHRHEQNSFPQIVLDFSESFVSVVVHPGKIFHSTLNWLSIDSRQLCVLVGLLKFSDPAFPLVIRFWMAVHLSQTQHRIWVDMHFCFRPLDRLTMTQSRSHPRRESAKSS